MIIKRGSVLIQDFGERKKNGFRVWIITSVRECGRCTMCGEGKTVHPFLLVKGFLAYGHGASGFSSFFDCADSIIPELIN